VFKKIYRDSAALSEVLLNGAAVFLLSGAQLRDGERALRVDK
jgi:hypothetical protein